MRTSVTSLSKKFISTFFAATLALGLVPAAAFAAEEEPTEETSVENVVEEPGIGETDGTQDDSTFIPAGQIINQEMPLEVVAQQESTRSYFLAQTLESTRTVPIVSADLPLDTSTADAVVEDDVISEDEGGEDSGESDLVSAPIAAESIVVGSFEYRGITYAVESGGESVAIVAADYSKLPEEFIEAQVIVLPSAVTADGLNYYTVTRIADNAFSTVKSQESEEGITAITIPASITEIGDDAFTGFDTLQYVIVSEDNPNYSQYDGCLYDADQTCLLLIPEGRLGAVRIASSVTEIDPEVFSHCPLVDTLVADADSAAYQLLEGDDLERSESGHQIAVCALGEGNSASLAPLDLDYYKKLMTSKATVDGSTVLTVDDRQLQGWGIGTTGSSDLQMVWVRDDFHVAKKTGGSQSAVSPTNSAAEWTPSDITAKDIDGFVWHGYWYGTGSVSVVEDSLYGEWFYWHYPTAASSNQYQGVWAIDTNGARNQGKVVLGMPEQAVVIDSNKANGALTTYTAFKAGKNGKTLNEFCYIQGIVNWYANADDASVSRERTMVIGANEKFFAPEAIREGYTCVGWSTDPDGETMLIGNLGEYCLEATTELSLYAQWVPLSRDVYFEPNDGASYSDEGLRSDGAVIWARYKENLPSTLKERTSDGSLYAGDPYDDAGERKVDALPGNPFSTLDVRYKHRNGYEFNGYWTTRYTEDSTKTELVEGRKVTPRQYYNSDMTPLGNWEETSNDATRLYAHWKYKIYLSANADGGSIDASSLDDGSLKTDAQGTYIDVIDGAPIRLPRVIERTGYYDSGKGTDGKTDVDARAWGVRAGAYGWATGIIPLDDDGATSGDPTKLMLDTSNIGSVRAYDNAPYFPGASAESVVFPVPTEASNKSVTLYLSWENRAKVYDVTLTSAYDPFTVSNSPTTTVKAVYDAPILMERSGATIVYADFLQSAATKGIVAPAYIVGSGDDAHHEYIFKGFRTQQNALDSTLGTLFVDADVTGTGADITAVAKAVAEPYRNDKGPHVLYAAWGRVVSTLTINLNGGSIAGLASEFTVKSGADDLTFDQGQPTKELPGIYGTMPQRTGYTFLGYYTKATDLTGEDAAFATSAETATTIPYFVPNANRTRVVPATDSATGQTRAWAFYTNVTLYAHWEYTIACRLVHSVDCASNADDVHTAITLKDSALSDGAKDRYGNSYPNQSTVTSEASVFAIRALADVPVKLPLAQGRNGYKDASAWQVREGDSVNAAAIHTVAGNAFDGYFTSTRGEGGALKRTAPLAGTDVKPVDATKTVTLFVDWTGQQKTYWVRVVYDRVSLDGAPLASITGGSPQYLKVTYNDVFPTNASGNVLTTVPRDDDIDRNLVFQGLFAEPAAVGTASGTKYVDAVSGDGGMRTPATSTVFAPKTRTDGYTIEDALVSSSTESAPPNPAKAYPVYARWTYPTCWVTFDLNTGVIGGASDSIKAFELQTNDSMPSLLSDASVPSRLKTVPAKYSGDKTAGQSDYRFDGYWSERVGGVQYYTSGLAPVSGRTWDFAGDKTLYAHWKYTVRLNLNASVPTSLADSYADGLLVHKPSSAGEIEPAPVSAAAAGAIATAYELEVTWGESATVPSTTESVERERFALPYDAQADAVPNDYLFAGWYRTEGVADDTQFSSASADVSLGGTARDDLAPTNGTVSLYAKWTSFPYTVVLDHKGGDASLASKNFSATGEPRLTGVTFDRRVLAANAAVPAPHRLGYRFLGYYDDADVRYLEPAADDTMVATDELWRHYDVAAGASVTLRARYEQIDYRIDFAVVSPDAINRVEPAEVESVSPVHYRDPLANFSSAARKLACTGYDFKGWQNADGTLMFDDAGAGLGTFAFERTITLSPVWEAKKIDVVWNPNWPAGSGSAPVAVTTSESFGQAFKGGAAPKAPFGYEFLGWFRDANDAATKVDVSEGATFRPASTEASSIPYFARWRAVPYKVTLLAGERASYDTKFGLEAEVKDRGNGDYRWEHTYTVAQGDWAFAQPRMLPGYTFAGWEQVRSVAAEDGTVTWEVVVASAPAYVNASSFEQEADLTFRAKGTATISKVTLDLNGADPSALGANPDTYDYAIGTPVTLPSALKWPGHTFLGWELTKRGSQTVAPSGKPSTEVTVVADPKAMPQPLVYQAQWKDDEYAISFVLSPVNSTPIADKVTGLGRTTEFAFPQPTFRGGFPVPAEGYAEGATVASDNASRIFMGYRIVTNAEAGTTAMFYPNDPASPKTVDELLKRYPGIRDTDGNEPRYGSVIEFHGVWETGYHVDVPLVVNMRFDPERVEESLQVGEAALCITAPDSTTRVDVVGLVCDPVAASSTVPGTVGAFDDRATCGNAYLTLWARQHSKQDESLPKGEAVEFNLGTVADESGVPLQSAAVMVDGQQTVRGLPELGFSFGGTTPEDRTLDLMFGLRFADGFDASTLTYLTDRSFQDTGKSVPIARVYYTLALAR